MSWMRSVGETVVKVNVWSAAIVVGRVFASVSDTARGAHGDRARLVQREVGGGVDRVALRAAGDGAGCAPDDVHEIEYQSPVVATSSLNVIAMFESSATSVALLPAWSC